MADSLAGGDLEGVLRRWRGEGMGYEEISRRLYADYRVELSAQTVRRWAKELGADSEAA